MLFNNTIFYNKKLDISINILYFNYRCMTEKSRKDGIIHVNEGSDYAID
jgi:hypothetical protein